MPDGPSKPLSWKARNPDKVSAQSRRRYERKGAELCAQAKLARAANPERFKALDRRYDLRKRYGITVEDYDARLEVQGGVCAICGNGPGSMSLAVDHCHGSGEIRGLLCSRCNTGLGHFKDSPDLLAKAIAYLARGPQDA